MSRIHNILFLCGRIFSPFYSGFMTFRSFCYRKGILKSHQLPVPVISVGNLTLGGTGKTPLVMYVTRYLLGMGRKPAVVSRGYKGTASEKVNVVSNGKEILLKPAASGDEPRLLAEALQGAPVLTGPRHMPP